MKNLLRNTISSSLFTITMIGASANAALVNTDLLVEGDKKAVLHEETGIEWMGYHATKGMSFSYVESQLLEGGKFEGWRLPTYNEVQAFMAEVGFNMGGGTVSSWSNTTQYSLLQPAAFRMFDFFGYNGTKVHFSGSASSTFIYKNNEDVAVRAGYQYRNSRYGSTPKPAYVTSYLNNSASSPLYMTPSNYDYTLHPEAIFIVSDGGETLSSKLNPMLNANNPAAEVSVPTTLGVLSFMLGIVSMRRKK